MIAALTTLLLCQAPPEAQVTPPRLLGDLPVVQPPAPRRGVQGVVRLTVTIDAEGAVSEAVVVQGMSAAVYAEVLDVVRGLRFAPATRGGEPIPVRITWQVPVGQPPRWQGRARRGPAPLPRAGDAALAGEVLEKGTRTPLAGLPVLLPEVNQTAITDADGRFSFDDLPSRPLRLEIPALDHEAVADRVTPPRTDLVYRLLKKRTVQYESIVEGQTSDASRIVIPVEQAREVPGTSGDALKVVEALPGIARPPGAGPNTGQLVVRGSAPEDTRYYIDGLPLFQLFHFGGIYSVVQDAWIEGIDYRAGGFSAEYGEATGGLLAVSLAPVPQDGVHGNVDVNIYHASALVTAPVGDGWAVGAGFRRSYIDAILPAVAGDMVDFTAAPRYYEYQARADYRPNRNVNLRLLVFGSDDRIALVSNEVNDRDPNSSGFELTRFFHQVQAALDLVLSPELTLYAGVATSYQGLTLAPSRQTRFDLTFDPVTARSHLTWRPSAQWEVRGGVWSTVTRFRTEANLPPPIKEGQPPVPASARENIVADESGFTGEVAAWAEATWRPVDAVALIGGLRVSGWLGAFDAYGVDPRLTFRWGVTDTTTLTASAGLYTQDPAPDEWSESFGNPDLGVERAVQTSLGVRQQIGDYLSVEVTGFYKYLFDLVAPSPVFGGPRYSNEGTGYAAGGELLVRLGTKWVEGWLSYTLSTSRRDDGPGEPERPFSFDQTHVLALVGSVNLTHDWRFGVRLRYATGNPFTPLTASYYDASADVYVPAEAAPPLSQRVDDFFQLDLRLDKTWTFDTWKLVTYLEVSNVTNRDNPEFVDYTYDYGLRQDVGSLPIIPSLGLRAVW